MSKQMKIGAKIGLGFGLLIVIAIVLGGLAVVNMSKVATESTKLAVEYVPELKVADEIQRASSRLMYAMRGYGFTENEAFYGDALKEIEEMEKSIEKGRTLSETARNLTKLNSQLDAIQNAEQAYKTAVKDTRDTIEELSVQRKALDQNAGIYMQASYEFLNSQNESFKRDLDDRQNKLAFLKDLVELGAAVRIMNFKGQSLKDEDMIQGAIEKLTEVSIHVDKLRKITRDPGDIKHIDDIVAAASGYQTAMREFLSEFRKKGAANETILEAARQKMDSNASLYVANCDEFFTDQQAKLTQDMLERNSKISLANDIIDLGNDARIKTFKSQALRDPSLIAEAQQNFPKIDKIFGELRKITRQSEDLRKIDTVQGAVQGYSQAMVLFLDGWKKLQQLGEKRNGLGQSMVASCIVMADAGMDNTVKIADGAMSSLNTSSTIMIIGLFIALVVGSLLAFFITRGITQSITKVADGLNEGAEQVASASGQVSSASQSLAEGSSEQAASVEEISSSLEEMASMTRQNADNASQADSLMKEANQVVASANASMKDLTKSMEEISKASEETSKIIKTIDEIAFQTNLLALNAAVEAARAGEAGAGFAVVADEVRNLAMRAADAAKNTATLIEGTVKKVNEGGILVSKTDEAFGEVAKSAAKVGDLVGEIAAASSEQAQGITQINTAISEVDKVTQQNAASAEESASASEEMNAQAEQMRSYVGELIALVSGSQNVPAARERSVSMKGFKKSHAGVTVQKKGKMMDRSTSKESSSPSLKPEKVIPLDNKDFEDF